MADYTHVKQATRIPVPGGKLIEEIFGKVNTQTDDLSLAHMVAPPGWAEPAQTPEFAEITLMVRGRMKIETGGELVELTAGQAIRIEAGVKVRYSNPYEEESEYYAICLPAFSIDTVNRDDEA
jgi:mannose-6-phosphate isomerase-like protein (cupin superfamily)